MNDEFADMELWIRPADEFKGGMNEQVCELSYQEMARWSSHSLVKRLSKEFDISHPGEWKVGIRDRGDEQYFQRFAIVEPHAEERGEWLLQNHFRGVLNHWRQ